MYLAFREPEGVAFDLRDLSWLLAFEIEAKECPDDGSQLFSLVVKGEEVTRLGVLSHEQKVQDADRLVALEVCEFVHDPAFEPGVRVEAYRQQLDRAYILRHFSPPSLFVAVCLRCRGLINSALVSGLAGCSWPPSGLYRATRR